MTLWRITGEASNDGGGGDMTVFALTRGPTDVPDTDRALATADDGHSWYNIVSVEQVAELPHAWTTFDESPLRHLIAQLVARGTIPNGEAK